MITKHLALALLGTALISAPALAQTSPAPSSTAPASGQMNSSNWMTQEQPGQWRASKLDGLNVYNNNDEKIGDISELIVDSGGNVKAVVIGVGGFLGLGEHDVAVPFDQIKFVNEPRANVAATNTGTTNMAGTSPGAPAATGTMPAPATTGSVGTTGTTADAANRSYPDHAVLNMTKDQLKAAPEFKYAR